MAYHSPRLQEPKTGEKRAIFVKLVPYGEVWLLGANAPTERTTTGNLKLVGKRLPAGTYSLFTIPQTDKRTLIVNKDVGQWGPYKYNKDQDVLRVDVPMKKSADIYEAFTVAFDDKGTELNFSCENTHISVSIRPAKKSRARNSRGTFPPRTGTSLTSAWTRPRLGAGALLQLFWSI